LGQCLAFFVVRTTRWLVLKLLGQIVLHERKRLHYFLYIFSALFGVPVRILGTISLYGHFLDNGS
jgi:hypothetical protein